MPPPLGFRTAGHVEHLAVDVGCLFRRREQERRAADSSGSADLADRNLLLTSSTNCSKLIPIRSAVARVISVSINPGATAHRDPEFAQLDRQGLGEALQSRLGRRIVGLSRFPRAEVEEMLMIRPYFCSTITFWAARLQ